MERHLLYTKSTDCKCQSHLENSFTATSRLVLDPTSGHHGSATLMHETHCRNPEAGSWGPSAAAGLAAKASWQLELILSSLHFDS